MGIVKSANSGRSRAAVAAARESLRPAAQQQRHEGRRLLEHPRQPMSRDKLMELARGREYDVFDRSIDVQISRLRKLIEPDPQNPPGQKQTVRNGHAGILP